MAHLNSITSLGRVLLAASLILTANLAACATPNARAQSVEIDDQVAVTFSSIEVDDHFRQLEVDYQLERDDWRWAQEREYDLWLTLYAPGGDDYLFMHGMPLQSRRGRVLFPEHVNYHNYPYVGLCVVAVGVGEQFDPGYGYVCEDPIRIDVYGRQNIRAHHTSVVFSLGFHSGLYGYSWFHPHYGFHYPHSYWGAYPPVIIRDRHRHHYHPRRHYRKRHRRWSEGDRHRHRDSYRDRRRPRRDRPRTNDERRGPTPRRIVVPRKQITPRQRVQPRVPAQPKQPIRSQPRRRIEPRQRINKQRINKQRIEPRQQVRPKQRIRVRPQQRQQVRPRQQIRTRPRQQIRPKQRQQIRQKQQIRPQQRRIQPRKK